MKSAATLWDQSEFDQFIEEAITATGNQIPSANDLLATIAMTVRATKTWLNVLFGDQPSELAVGAVAKHYANRADWDGRQLDPTSAQDVFFALAECSHLRDDINVLYPYAEDGAVLVPSFEPQETALSKALSRSAEILPLIPREWFNNDQVALGYQSLWLVFGKARARYRLDEGNDLFLVDVALLSGITMKSVSNASQKRHGDKRLIVSPEGIVQNEDALAWLMSRKGFVASPGLAATRDVKELPISRPEDITFVPVDESGQPFLPNTVSHSISLNAVTYRLIIDGKEREVTGYFQALDLMMVAQSVAWHSAKGDKVSYATGWKRLPRIRLRRMELEMLVPQRNEMHEFIKNAVSFDEW